MINGGAWLSYTQCRDLVHCSQDRCRFRNVNGTLPSFWDFLQLAIYVGQVEVRSVTYDVWEFFVSVHAQECTVYGMFHPCVIRSLSCDLTQAAGIRISLGVTPSAPNVPGILQRDAAQNMVAMIFLNFKAGEADPKTFDVPSQCRKPSAHKSAEGF